jgi:hypothetical protein
MSFNRRSPKKPAALKVRQRLPFRCFFETLDNAFKGGPGSCKLWPSTATIFWPVPRHMSNLPTRIDSAGRHRFAHACFYVHSNTQTTGSAAHRILPMLNDITSKSYESEGIMRAQVLGVSSEQPGEGCRQDSLCIQSGTSGVAAWCERS